MMLDDEREKKKKNRKSAFEVYGKHHRASRLEQRTAVSTGQEAQLDQKSVFSVQHQAGTGTALQWEAFLQA